MTQSWKSVHVRLVIMVADELGPNSPQSNHNHYIFIAISVIHSGWLTHWGRVTHIYVSDLTIIGSDNGLSPGRHQTIIWTNAWILLIWLLGTNVSEILIKIHTFSLQIMSSGNWRPFCLGLNVLSKLLTFEYVLHLSFNPHRKRRLVTG